LEKPLFNADNNHMQKGIFKPVQSIAMSKIIFQLINKLRKITPTNSNQRQEYLPLSEIRILGQSGGGEISPLRCAPVERRGGGRHTHLPTPICPDTGEGGLFTGDPSFF
jgi:hypothetical protein